MIKVVIRAHFFGMSMVCALMLLPGLLWGPIIFLRWICMVFWMIYKTCIKFGTVVNITKTHFSQRKFVHVLRVFVTPVSIDVIHKYEHWVTYGTYMKINRDAASFIIDVDWIVRNFVIRLLRSKNLNILCVKRPENKTTICLACFLFHNQVVLDSWGFVRADFQYFNVFFG